MAKPVNTKTPTKIELLSKGYSETEIRKIIKDKNKK